MALVTGERVASGRCVIDADGYQVTKPSGAAVNGIGSTLSAWFTVTSGAANAVLAVITAPTVGVYDVTADVFITGTAETTPINLRLRENTNEVSQIPTLTGSPTKLRWPRVSVSGGNLDLQIKGTTPVAGSIYTVVLTATRLS
jgi:hypothetical protein